MTETPLRSIAKTLTWQVTGLVVMTAITWAITGSVATGGAVALLGSAAGTVSYLIHERLWARVGWGMTLPATPAAASRAASAAIPQRNPGHRAG